MLNRSSGCFTRATLFRDLTPVSEMHVLEPAVTDDVPLQQQVADRARSLNSSLDFAADTALLHFPALPACLPQS